MPESKAILPVVVATDRKFFPAATLFWEMIYFAETFSGKQRFVKIGFTDNPERRLKQLQGGCPFPLKFLLVEEGDRSDESVMHCRFFRSRHRNEWFLFRGDLKRYIEKKLELSLYG